MTMTELSERLYKIGVPVAYYEFKESDRVRPPFIAYFDAETESISADYKNFGESIHVVIELYTNYSDRALEKAVQEAVGDLEYTKSKSYIKEEQIWLTAYHVTIFDIKEE